MPPRGASDMEMGYALSGGGLAWVTLDCMNFQDQMRSGLFSYGSWPELELEKALKTTVGKSCRGQSKAAHCVCEPGGSS